jgi:circadian clock protein KaiC
MSLLGGDGADVGASIGKLATGIDGFDHVAMGGLPTGRATVLAGQAGSAKTVFAAQFLAGGARAGQPGVFVTVEEPARDLRANLSTLGMPVQDWERAGLWRFVDASPVVRADGQVQPYSFEVLAAQVGRAVDETGAQRVVVDSLTAALALQDDKAVLRQQLRRLVSSLRGMGLTTVLTVETTSDPGASLSPYGVEEFVADGVVLLRNVREGTFRRRTVEVLKLRGAMHHKGDVGFTVVPGRGVVVLPVTAPRASERDDEQRTPSGNEGLDRLLGGGLLPGSTALLSGPTGTGKTLLAMQFALEGAARGERALLLSYEESPEQVRRNARRLGHDAEAYERHGLLTVVSHYPEIASLDDHLVEVRDRVAAFRPTRLVLDSLSALERIGSASAFREFVIGMTSYARTQGLVTLVTSATTDLVGATSVTSSHVSGLVDAIVLLRHVEHDGRLERGLLVLKVRGSDHAHTIHRLQLGEHGLVVAEPFEGMSGVLTGQVVPVNAS